MQVTPLSQRAHTLKQANVVLGYPPQDIHLGFSSYAYPVSAPQEHNMTFYTFHTTHTDFISFLFLLSPVLGVTLKPMFQLMLLDEALEHFLLIQRFKFICFCLFNRFISCFSVLK